jgi:hypothetical protein
VLTSANNRVLQLSYVIAKLRGTYISEKRCYSTQQGKSKETTPIPGRTMHNLSSTTAEQDHQPMKAPIIRKLQSHLNPTVNCNTKRLFQESFAIG